MGVSITTNPKTIEKWYRNFRDKRAFCIPLKTKHSLPPILELNPDVCHAIKEYVCLNLSTLSVEKMSEYIHRVVLPQMIEKEKKRKENDNNLELESTLEENELPALLKMYGLTCICLSTVYRWMKKLGFNYEPRKKGYSLAILPAKLEQMVKKFKTHRCAMDFDHSFCKSVYHDSDSPC